VESPLNALRIILARHHAVSAIEAAPEYWLRRDVPQFTPKGRPIDRTAYCSAWACLETST
jgi:hypothetical protein